MTGAPPIGAARLARLLLRARLRSFRNGLRLRGRVRTPLLVATAALLTAVAYVGLFAQSFAVVVATVGPAAQAAALATVTGLVAFASWAAKAASSEALRAGSPENEFLLARPITLGALVAGRGAADALTDPMGALFLFPVLFAASLVWGLPASAWVLAAVVSVLVQLGISMLAYATQVALVRLIPAARRRGAWVAMRLISALALAALWMVGTGVLRDPAGLARRWGAPPAWVSWTPGGLIAAPLAAWAGGDPAAALAALGRLALAVGALVVVAIAAAQRAGLGGWEEAGASWAEAAAAPAASRPITAGNKDLRLIVRDRTQLMVLVAMPAIFVGVQIFGAAGWTWSTASLTRVACLSYSLALYMATIGPLTHMQAERRAFWILRAVPVPLGRLLAAKARAWAVIVGGTAAVTFTALVFLMPPAPGPAVLAAGLLVAGGAAAMSFLAVAMASGGADLSDDQSPAVGPTTIYAFLLVGGLYNLVLTGDTATRGAGLLLYLFTVAAYWRDGVARAEICFDAEAIRAPRLRLADAATLALVWALAGRGLASAAAATRGRALGLVLGMGLAARLALAAFGWHLLRRAGPARARRPHARLRVAAAAVLGAATGWALARGAGLAPARTWPAGVWLGASLGAIAEEIVWRGALRGALARAAAGRGVGPRAAQLISASASAALAVAALVLAGTTSGGGIAVQVIATVAAAAGGLPGALAAHLAFVLTRLTVGLFP